MIEEILNKGTIEEKKELFSFSVENTVDEIEVKYNLWIRHFFIKYLKSKDAPFHKEIDRGNIKCYLGVENGGKKYFTDIAFRGAAKTSRTKLFIAFVICNDKDRFRKYLKVLSSDDNNSTQIVTDVYNMLIHPRIKQMYYDIFKKTETKREETRSSFTTFTGIKMIAGTVGTEQRGAIQEENRPDFIWFEDFENRTTIKSAVKTNTIWGNMEEARTSLSKNGSCIYTCNYISEKGNVHKLVIKKGEHRLLLKIPIIKDGVIAWDRYSNAEIEQMKIDDEDFEGERLCEPSASKDIYFDRESLNKQEIKTPIKETAGLKIYHEYDPSHKLGGGHDVGGGVNLDSSTSVYIDFSTIPAKVTGTFSSNEVKPEAFGYEIIRENQIFGGCIEGIENNYGTEAILVCKQNNINLYRTETKDVNVKNGKKTTFGWNTNQLTKPKMLSAVSKAVKDGLIELSDEDLINECKSYTRNDLIENVKDPRLLTKHYDLLMALAIAWQMKDHAFTSDDEEDEDISIYSDYS